MSILSESRKLRIRQDCELVETEICMEQIKIGLSPVTIKTRKNLVKELKERILVIESELFLERPIDSGSLDE